jgi:hypothetical protein
MHVRHLAWLASCPVDTTKEKVKDKRNRFQRLEQSNPNAPELVLPEIEGAEYIISLLHEAGPVGSNGYGVEGLKWSEIHSWIASTGLFLSSWEVLLIKELSDVYASEYNKSNGKECLCPSIPKVVDKQTLNDKFAAIFGSWYEQQKK